MRGAFTLLVLLAGMAAPQTTVLRDFTLIDGRSVPKAALIIANGRIQWAGEAARLKLPPGAAVVSLAGKYVMPGMINLHGHLGNVVGLTQDPKFYTRENVEQDLRTYAAYGVTSVLSMGTDKPLIYEIRAEQRLRPPTAARVFTAGRGFTGKDGYPTSVPGMSGVPYEVATLAEVAQDVAELARNKPDVVKIWVDDHLGKDKKIPLDLAKAIVRESHRHGLKVAAHVFYLADAKELVGAGLDGLAHSVRDQPVDLDLIQRMKQHGAWQLAATLTREASTFTYARPPAFLKDPFFTRSVSRKVIATLESADFQRKISADPDFPKYEGFLETAERNLKRLADAGVKYAFGTDTGPPMRFPGFSEHWELELMVKAGLTPAQALTASTRSAAEFLGVSKELGTLEPGKWADFVVLGSNPVDDIRNTRSIEAVYIAGSRIR